MLDSCERREGEGGREGGREGRKRDAGEVKKGKGRKGEGRRGEEMGEKRKEIQKCLKKKKP